MQLAVVEMILCFRFCVTARGFDHMKALDLKLVNFHFPEVKLLRFRPSYA